MLLRKIRETLREILADLRSESNSPEFSAAAKLQICRLIPLLEQSIVATTLPVPLQQGGDESPVGEQQHVFRPTCRQPDVDQTAMQPIHIRPINSVEDVCDLLRTCGFEVLRKELEPGEIFGRNCSSPVPVTVLHILRKAG